MIASKPSSQPANTKMYPEFTMSFAKAIDWPAFLADDFAVWSAALSWDWKPQKAKEIPKPIQTRRVAYSENQLYRLPTPPISPQSSFGETSSRTFLLTPSTSSISSSSAYSSPSSPPSEILFSTKYFEVRLSHTKKGYGAFATRDIPRDTEILSEKALFRSTLVGVYYAYENLTLEQRKAYRTLHGWHEVDPQRILAIFKTNRFEITRDEGGIFLKSSRYNHACHPHANCTYKWMVDQEHLVTTSLYDIPKGTEITISYCGHDSAASLHDKYGFYCDCDSCPDPKEAAAAAARRKGRK